MATPIKGGKLIPFEREFIERISGVSGQSQEASAGFFGPSQPLKPLAPEEVRGRKLDYPQGFNLNYTPRREGNSTNNLDFATLRRIADPGSGGLDIVRLVIETIKDTVSGLEWKIIPKTEAGKTEQTDLYREKIKAITKRLNRPDGNLSWSSWVRQIIEDHLVIDQPAIYIRKNPDGKVCLDAMDGALIKLLIDPSGRTPYPPFAAYQQQLHGLPAVDYSTAELIVPIYNRRSNKIYGYSRVEQIVNIINLGLRRQLSQIEYWSVGNVPDMLIGVPDSWNVDQIGQYQLWFDSILSGNTGERRKARFIPTDAKPYPISEPPLKSELDDWIARIVSYAFSVPHEWAVKEMNKATAESSANTAKEQGLKPIKKWVASVIDEILEKAFDAPELHFAWDESASVDPKTQMDILRIAVGQAPIMTVDEARDQLGLEPLGVTEFASPEEALRQALGENQQNTLAYDSAQRLPVGDEPEEEEEPEEIQPVRNPFIAGQTPAVKANKYSKKKRISYRVFSY